MSTDKVRVEIAQAIATITLNDPATLNACGLEMADGLREAVLDVTRAGSGVRAVVLTGEGRAFCSGANLSAPRSAPADSGKIDMGAGLEAVYNPLVTTLREMTVPLVTAVRGAAAGIGCSLALMGDLIVASQSGYFMQAFRRIGLVPDGGSTWMLPRLIGRPRAMEMVLLGEKAPAAQALEWGLINRVVPEDELMPTAMDFARRIADGPFSLGLTRKLINESETAGWAEQLNAERHAQKMAGESADAAEGVAAFLQKRPAAFTGR